MREKEQAIKIDKGLQETASNAKSSRNVSWQGNMENFLPEWRQLEQEKKAEQ